MIKNIQFVLFTIFCSTLIFFSVKNFAETSPKTLNDGVYLGVSVGYDVFSSENKMDQGPLLYYDPTINAQGINGGAFLGYRKFFEKYYKTYLGAEFFVSGSSAETKYDLKINNNTFTTEVNVVSTFGLSLTPGIHINPSTLLYLRLGYNWAKIEVDQIYTNPNVFPFDLYNFNTFGGVVYGLGFETLLFEKLDMRFEYQFTQYNDLDTQSTATISPMSQQWTIGLVYRAS